MFKISIPTPCHEDWQAMTPNEQGCHCTSCAKTVIDFTVMSDDEVKYFFLNKKEEKVCGRFRNQQLEYINIHLPKNIFSQPLPLWKHFLAACLLAFGMMLFSCNTSTTGKAMLNVREIIIPKDTTLPDSFSKCLPPPPICTTVGDIKMIYVQDSVTTGVIDVEPPLPSFPSAEVVNLKEEIIIDSLDQKIKGDSVKLKNPPKTDSINCDIKVFY
jgi:hypothetical protein